MSTANNFGDFGGFVKVIAALRARGVECCAAGVPMILIGRSESDSTPFGYVPGLKSWGAMDWRGEEAKWEHLADHGGVGGNHDIEAIALAIHRHHTSRIT